MNTLINDSTIGAEAATLTKTELFERFLGTQCVRRGWDDYSQEDALDDCETALWDCPQTLIDTTRSSDDPAEELFEIVQQVKGCAIDLEEVMIDFQNFVTQFEAGGGRVTTRICISHEGMGRLCGEYEERDGEV
ncbi:MAG: hypothetical protein KDJ17_01495, partial [Hyphomicrobiaceae bacterium]|nr:hypothetical protein [Hyphomicrobiaceae bacterium]